MKMDSGVKWFSSTASWFNKHVQDSYVRDAKESGYRARSAFKLLQILEEYPFISPGMVVIDCGAAPGSWSQVISERLKANGKILAVDLLPIGHISGVDSFQGDINSDEFKSYFLPYWLKGRKLDCIISDICPNLSGNRDVDSAKSYELVLQCIEIARLYLKNGGSLLTKFMTGGYEKQYYRNLITSGFSKVHRIKPRASRKTSSEIFFLGLNYQKDMCSPLQDG